MNRVIRGTVVLAAVFGVLSCKGDPTSDLRNGVDHLVATPSALYVDNDNSQNVVVNAVDAQGNQIGTHFQLTSVGSGITVTPDDSFNLIYDNNGNLVPPTSPTRVRYIVGFPTTNTYVASQFVVTAGGKSLTIPVRTAAATLVSNVSNLTPNPGDTITVDAPAGISFNPASVVVAFGSDTEFVTSATATQVSFVSRASKSGPANISGVMLDYAPAAGEFTVPTAQNITVGPAPDLTVNQTASNLGDTIVVQAHGAYRFTPASTPSIGTAPTVLVDISADSLTMRFLIGPAADTAVSVDNMVISGASALGTFTLGSGTVLLSSPAVTDIPVTFSTATPNVNDNVTVTAPAGFKFLPNASVRFGNDVQYTVSVAADSGSLVFRAHQAGASGQITMDNVALSFLTSVPIDVPTTVVATVGATVTELPGTDAVGTAPPFSIPAVAGRTSGIVDAPSGWGLDLSGLCGGCTGRVYKFTVGTAATVGVTANWNSDEDLGVYLADDTGGLLSTSTYPPADNFGSGATGHPETTSWSLPTGNYTVLVISFGSAPLPTSFTMDFDVQSVP